MQFSVHNIQINILDLFHLLVYTAYTIDAWITFYTGGSIIASYISMHYAWVNEVSGALFLSISWTQMKFWIPAYVAPVAHA